jgi:hypothetical protein
MADPELDKWKAVEKKLRRINGSTASVDVLDEYIQAKAQIYVAEDVT